MNKETYKMLYSLARAIRKTGGISATVFYNDIEIQIVSADRMQARIYCHSNKNGFCFFGFIVDWYDNNISGGRECVTITYKDYSSRKQCVITCNDWIAA